MMRACQVVVAGGVSTRQFTPPDRFTATVGDAPAVSMTPWTGIGVNAAIHDGVRFGDLYDQLATARSAGDCQCAMSQFARRTRATSLAMLAYEQLIGAGSRHLLSLALAQPLAGPVATRLLRGALEVVARTLA